MFGFRDENRLHSTRGLMATLSLLWFMATVALLCWPSSLTDQYNSTALYSHTLLLNLDPTTAFGKDAASVEKNGGKEDRKTGTDESSLHRNKFTAESSQRNSFSESDFATNNHEEQRYPLRNKESVNIAGKTQLQPFYKKRLQSNCTVQATLDPSSGNKGKNGSADKGCIGNNSNTYTGETNDVISTTTGSSVNDLSPKGRDKSSKDPPVESTAGNKTSNTILNWHSSVGSTSRLNFTNSLSDVASNNNKNGSSETGPSRIPNDHQTFIDNDSDGTNNCNKSTYDNRLDDAAEKMFCNETTPNNPDDIVAKINNSVISERNLSHGETFLSDYIHNELYSNQSLELRNQTYSSSNTTNNSAEIFENRNNVSDAINPFDNLTHFENETIKFNANISRNLTEINSTPTQLIKIASKLLDINSPSSNRNDSLKLVSLSLIKETVNVSESNLTTPTSSNPASAPLTKSDRSNGTTNEIYKMLNVLSLVSNKKNLPITSNENNSTIRSDKTSKRRSIIDHTASNNRSTTESIIANENKNFTSVPENMKETSSRTSFTEFTPCITCSSSTPSPPVKATEKFYGTTRTFSDNSNLLSPITNKPQEKDYLFTTVPSAKEENGSSGSYRNDTFLTDSSTVEGWQQTLFFTNATLYFESCYFKEALLLVVFEFKYLGLNKSLII